MRRFTWRLAPSATRTALNAAHGSKLIFSGLESITFIRSLANGSVVGDILKAVGARSGMAFDLEFDKATEVGT